MKKLMLLLAVALVLAAGSSAQVPDEADAAIPLLSGEFNLTPEDWDAIIGNDGAAAPWWIDKWDVEGEWEISPCFEHEVCGDHGEGNTVTGGPLVVVLPNGNLALFYYDAAWDDGYSSGGASEGDSSSNEQRCANVGEWDYDRCLSYPEEYGV